MSEDTIMALASGRGKAGLAVLRLSGPASGEVLDRLTGGKKRPVARRFSVRRLTDPRNGQLLDRAGILYMPGPHSFTGEDVAELHIHGGGAVLEAVLAAALAAGPCRLAEAGEFSRRAFEHGRLDLTASEGMADLIDAETEGQRRAALRLYEGESAQMFERWRYDLIEAMAALETAIDFPDEADTGADPSSPVRGILVALRAEIAGALARAGQDRAVREGFVIAILGAPNVGKSSLLNALAGRDAAIVSEIPGTTRDIVEARLDWGGFPVLLQDTAGLRETSDPVEREGVVRSRRVGDRADLCLWVIEATPFVMPEALAADDILLINKSDLAQTPVLEGGQQSYRVSALTGEGLETLRDALILRVRQTLQSEAPPLASHMRHQTILSEALSALDRGVDSLDAGVSAELVAEDIRLAAQALASLTGRVGPEEMLDQIFARFCIGK